MTKEETKETQKNESIKKKNEIKNEKRNPI